MTDPLSFTIHAVTMKRALAFASQATERRNTIPILGMVKVDFADDKVTITGTDLDVECEAEVEAITGSAQPFSFTMQPRLLTGLLRYAEGDVTIAKEGDIITITADDMTAQARELCPPEDWPALNMGNPCGLPVSVSEARLHKAMTAAMACVSTEVTRYYLNGVYMHDTGKGLICVATDGLRLAKYETSEGWGLPAAIFPRKSASILTAAIRKDGNAKIEATAFVVEQKPKREINRAGLPTGNLIDQPALPRLAFKGDGWTIRSKTIDGTFPDYTRVIPPKQEAPGITATISAAAIRRFPPTGDRVTAVKIDPNGGAMSIQNCEGFSVKMPIQGKGPSMGFNLKYLAAFARSAGTIKLEAADPGSPARVLTDDPALLQILMPMRL